MNYSKAVKVSLLECGDSPSCFDDRDITTDEECSKFLHNCAGILDDSMLLDIWREVTISFTTSSFDEKMEIAREFIHQRVEITNSPTSGHFSRPSSAVSGDIAYTEQHVKDLGIDYYQSYFLEVFREFIDESELLKMWNDSMLLGKQYVDNPAEQCMSAIYAAMDYFESSAYRQELQAQRSSPSFIISSDNNEHDMSFDVEGLNSTSRGFNLLDGPHVSHPSSSVERINSFTETAAEVVEDKSHEVDIMHCMIECAEVRFARELKGEGSGGVESILSAQKSYQEKQSVKLARKLQKFERNYAKQLNKKPFGRQFEQPRFSSNISGKPTYTSIVKQGCTGRGSEASGRDYIGNSSSNDDLLALSIPRPASLPHSRSTPSMSAAAAVPAAARCGRRAIVPGYYQPHISHNGSSRSPAHGSSSSSQDSISAQGSAVDGQIIAPSRSAVCAAEPLGTMLPVESLIRMRSIPSTNSDASPSAGFTQPKHVTTRQAKLCRKAASQALASESFRGYQPLDDYIKLCIVKIVRNVNPGVQIGFSAKDGTSLQFSGFSSLIQSHGKGSNIPISPSSLRWKVGSDIIHARLDLHGLFIVPALQVVDLIVEYYDSGAGAEFAYEIARKNSPSGFVTSSPNVTAGAEAEARAVSASSKKKIFGKHATGSGKHKNPPRGAFVLQLIVGKGLHSSCPRGKLGPAVEQHLREEWGIHDYVSNDGTILVPYFCE